MSRPFVSIHPGMQGGAPTISNTRRKVTTLAGPVILGHTTDTVADWYGATREEVLLACWFVEYQPRRIPRGMRTAWRRWAFLYAATVGLHPDKLDDPPKP